MANKLIQDLAARANVLVTDLLEVQPVAGPPSQKGTVTQIFTDASGNLAIDRDGRFLAAVDGGVSVLWQTRELWHGAGNLSLSWQLRQQFDSSDVLSVDWESRQLINTNGDVVCDWEQGRLFQGTKKVLEWASDLMLFDITEQNSVDWQNRQLIGSDGTTVILDWNTTTPASVVQRVFSTATDPNGVVTATKPSICYGDDGSLWVKTTAGPDNTGWVVLISA